MNLSQNILAALMARRNMGHGMPSRDETRHLVYRENVSLDNAVQVFCMNLIESDEHYDMFMEEAQAWMDGDIREHHENAVAEIEKHFEPRRWKHAKIANDGASNQRLLARVLHEAIVEAQEECADLKEDGAVQVILLQLSHVLGQPKIIELPIYKKWIDQIDEHTKPKEEANAG